MNVIATFLHNKILEPKKGYTYSNQETNPVEAFMIMIDKYGGFSFMITNGNVPKTSCALIYKPTPEKLFYLRKTTKPNSYVDGTAVSGAVGACELDIERSWGKCVRS